MIRVPSKVSRISKSASPVTTASAPPLTATSRNLSSLGSLQAPNQTPNLDEMRGHGDEGHEFAAFAQAGVAIKLRPFHRRRKLADGDGRRQHEIVLSSPSHGERWL